MPSIEKLRLLHGNESTTELTASRSKRSLERNVIIYGLSSCLGISILLNILQFVYSTANVVDNLSIFPELRHLRIVVKSEHPEHGVAFSKFDGRPSNESAQAWGGLLSPFYFNLSSHELADADFSRDTAVRVKDGGYLASLGVYHELHCLNQMRNFLYTRTDPAKFTTKEVEYWQGHLGHCIEVLRLSVMCSADLSIYTFTWPKEENFTFLDAHSKSPRKCVDWDQVEQWSTKRKISLAPTVIYPDETIQAAMKQPDFNAI